MKEKRFRLQLKIDGDFNGLTSEDRKSLQKKIRALVSQHPNCITAESFISVV
jgi:hypothetical protein